MGRLFRKIIEVEPIEFMSLDLHSNLNLLMTSWLRDLEQDITIFEKLFAFGYNFLDASIGTSSPNASVCRGNITIFTLSINEIQDFIYFQKFDHARESIRNLFKSVDPITFACYYSLFEYVEIA